MEGIAYPAPSGDTDQTAVKKARAQREKSLREGTQSRLAAESMKEREVEHAIKVTEERLQELKGAVQRKKYSRAENNPARLAGEKPEPGPSDAL